MVPVAKLKEDFDLSAKNPAKQNDVEHLAPKEILQKIYTKNEEVAVLLGEIEILLAEK